MRQIGDNALSRSIIAVFAAFALGASFILVLNFGMAYCFFPERTENPAWLIKSDDAYVSCLKTDSQRIHTLLETNGSRYSFYPVHVKACFGNSLLDLKNTIFVRLRI